MLDNYGDTMKARKKLLVSFPGSYINSRDEFIAHPRTNQYFLLANCATPEDIQAKVLEWLSRAAFKTAPYSQEWRNDRFHNAMRVSINAFWAQPLPKRIWRSFIASWETASTTS